MLEQEVNMGLDTLQPYSDFAEKIKNPAAWFVSAFKEDRRHQGELFSPEQRAKEIVNQLY